jgi:membrane-bound serine protease (ClpP class)
MGRVVAAAALFSSIIAAVGSQSVSQTAQAPVAIVAEYDGIIHPIAAEFFDEVMARADTSGATVTVFVLRTPGGLLDSTRTIVSRMIAARTPVVIFVGPSGGRAASAGFIIAVAADVVVMAPGTHIGAAHPVSAGGESKADETMAKKAASDAAAYARTLAGSRGRNAALAAAAVVESQAFTEREALEATPPLIDFVASDVDDLLRQLDGRPIARFDGHKVTLDTTGIRIERAEMTRRQYFLSAIAHPQIAYLLLTLGMLGLTVELWNPGAIVPGVLGGIALLLAFFAFQILPVNTIGLLLIAFGLALLIVEIKIPSFGVLGTGGAAALVIGSVMITNDLPGVRVSSRFVVPVALSLAAIFLFLGRLAMNAQRLKPVSGAEGLVGEHGRTLTAVGPDQLGQVNVHGEIWRATSASPIPSGREVRVTTLTGLTLVVEPLAQEPRMGDPS